MAQQQTYSTIILAGGCFWCMEKPFEQTEGVIKAVSGYTGGHTENPSYEDISHKQTGHYEAVKITYDPKKTSLDALLDIFWQNIDPFDDSGQFCDRGNQYRAAIFYATKEEQQLAQESRNKHQTFYSQEIKTPILPAKKFWDAENYHQNYYKENPVRYNFYRYRCGRDQRLQDIKESKKVAGVEETQIP